MFMRSARILGCVALLLALAGNVTAQTVPYPARVIVSEAEVRSGPSVQMYPTNRLRQGDPVEVVEVRSDGWLAITPPRGSFSWIETRWLQPRPGNIWVVHTAAQPLIGSEVIQDQPTVRGPWLQPGFLLHGIDGPRSRLIDRNGVEWQAVQAPPGKEVRFIQGGEVMQVSGPLTTVAARQPSPAAGPAPPADSQAGLLPSSQPPRVEPPSNNPLWIQARMAQQAGRISEAITLYEQLGQQLAGTNHSQAMLCFNEAAYLRNSYRSYSTSYAPSNMSGMQPAAAPPLGLSLGAPSLTPRPTVPSYYASAAAPAPAGQWSGPGRLRVSGRSVDGRTTYVLETVYGQTLMYVTASPSINLDPYVGRMVELSGPLVYRGDIRANYMTAQYAVPAP
jgi:hypothetical protein